jgi:phosphoribosylamine--glycine ligase
MKVLVVGSGGREHTLCWALARSPRVETLRCAPGNAGIAGHAERVDIAAEDVDGLTRHAVDESYDLVVIGPEAPLVAGLADRLRDAGVAVFGPSADAARLEGSKAHSKQFMERHGVPTAAFRVFEGFPEIEAYLREPGTAYPLVLKADGLAAGKGVLIVDDVEAAVDGARSMLVERAFGDAGRRVVVEQCLRGTEASFFVLCDGERFVELATCQDYKRARDGDLGPNTGGMGTYSPSAYLDPAARDRIVTEIVRPTIDGLAAEGTPYRGVLFIGVMLTAEGPKVLEYNCRFGDPETQVLLPRLDGDWADLLERCAHGRLEGVEVRWARQAAVCVVLASEGYPGSYPKGIPIDGLDRAADLDGVLVFHAGTAYDEDGRVVTSGGRVLGVTALGDDLGAARERAYSAVEAIDWEGAQHRSDIALDALSR